MFNTKNDKHNFGQSVSIGLNNKIFKPRCLFWEWLFLSENKLRNYLNEIYIDDISIMSNWPTLEFTSIDNFNTGYVDYLILNPIYEISLINCKKIGFTYALLLWFGIGDLHDENVVAGINSKGDFIFSPIDIELIFENNALLTQALLLESDDLESNLSGSNKIRKFITNGFQIIEICKGFSKAIESLNIHRNKILEILEYYLDIYKPKIRKVIRSTMEYQKILEKNSIAENATLNYSEKIQLNRGDIPYFFRFLESKDLYYFDQPNNTSKLTNQMFDLGNKKQIESLMRDQICYPNKSHLNKIVKFNLLQIIDRLSNREFVEAVGHDFIVYKNQNSIILMYDDIKIKSYA